MKAKKISGKIALNKETVANLSSHEMNDANGGYLTFGSNFGCQYTLDTICVVSYCYCEITVEESCEIPRCLR